ncbi:UPF0280 family protein [Labrenzia sp. 011]|uniref:UPF0280 family protein n=1 Tax=Labrenzia sp. 011 TaxID=2171494 RepID=UPI000D520378|nr:UPF0280 family protein [Labrenzia sp. 011]PVB60122.1 UPF0280 family protein [Labrenzia sp. 011]
MSRRTWSETPTAQMLPDGRRLHLQHGPIDLVLEAFGEPEEVLKAYAQVQAVFPAILTGLTEELPRLRAASGPPPAGPVAKTMWAATRPFAPEFITPMAAVAGSVADYVLSILQSGRTLTRAYVNNGGDIALFVRDGSFRIGICDDPAIGLSGGTVEIGPNDGVGGLATSGWRGRSHSLGIADAVTVLARSAAEADAAATLIANKVDLPLSPKITRTPACELSPDSDLEDRPVTTNVAELTPGETDAALQCGVDAAQHHLATGRILAAYIALSGERRVVFPQLHITTNEMREAACA